MDSDMGDNPEATSGIPAPTGGDRGAGAARPQPPRRFAFLLMPGHALMSTAAAIEPLRAANLLMARPVYDLTFVSAAGGPVASSAGSSFDTRPLAEAGAGFDIAFVVAGGDPLSQPTPAADGWLRRLAARGVALGGIGDGEGDPDAEGDDEQDGEGAEPDVDAWRDALAKALMDGDSEALKRLARNAVSKLGKGAAGGGRESYYSYRVMRALSPDTLVAQLLGCDQALVQRCAQVTGHVARQRP